MTSVENADEGRAWDWTDDVGDVIVAAQPAIASYVNTAGNIVLRQQGDAFDEDVWIWFDPQHAPAVAMAILVAAGIDATALTPEPARACSKPKGASGAERQRRYRDRQKKGSTPEPDLLNRNSVTRDERNGVTPRNVTRDGGAA